MVYFSDRLFNMFSISVTKMLMPGIGSVCQTPFKLAVGVTSTNTGGKGLRGFTASRWTAGVGCPPAGSVTFDPLEQKICLPALCGHSSFVKRFLLL